MRIQGQRLKILVLSNLYPPHYIGGYELGCQDIVVQLQRRGHQVKVLTSTYGVGKPSSDGTVFRWLQTDIGWTVEKKTTDYAKLLLRELRNRAALKRLNALFTPDLVYVFNLSGISISLVFWAWRLGLPVCYFVSDGWLSRWEDDLWYALWKRQPSRIGNRIGKALIQRLLSSLGMIQALDLLEFHHVQFVSEFMRQITLNTQSLKGNQDVIHWGIDINKFRYRQVNHGPKRLLFVGQVMPHKGPLTAIEAFKVILDHPGCESTRLTIAGGSVSPEYGADIKRSVNALGLGSRVDFTGLVPREHLPSIYREHDILIFPSIWNEPFSITLLEAMASGLAVVGTTTGGSAEILENESNALVFPKGDTQACAAQLIRLLRDSDLFETIRQNARRTVEERFTLAVMVDAIEKSLWEATESTAGGNANTSQRGSLPPVNIVEGDTMFHHQAGSRLCEPSAKHD